MGNEGGKYGIVVAGMMRSGTTLLQKALNAHPNIDISYQVNTSRFIGLKKRFLDEVGESPYHVLAHYNPSSGYRFSEFVSWSEDQPEAVALSDPGKTWVEDEVRVAGVKEVLIEEFYPALLRNGVYCLNIIRDPRDTIASMSFGGGQTCTGKQRPVLFDLRNWRKSVHIAHYLSNQSRFKGIFFEDLVLDTEKVLEELFAWLDIAPVSVADIAERIRRSCWPGNSSFGPKKAFDASAVNNHKAVLPESVEAYIEAVCRIEMEHLGYSIGDPGQNRRDIIANYSDPIQITRTEFDPEYSSLYENVQYELARCGKSFIELNKEFTE